MYDLVISIINYRTAALSWQSITSAIADLDTCPDLSGHIVLVDNHSNDGSLEELSGKIAKSGLQERVTIVASEINGGFAAGHNLGVSRYSARFYLLFNSDAVLIPGAVRALIDAAEANPEAGLFAPQIVHDSGEQHASCFRFHNPVNEFARGASSGPISKLLKASDINLSVPPDESQIEWASFACILVRQAVFETAGLMDEGFFLYFEDEEYCHRARKQGWRIKYVHKAKVIHYRGGSAPVKSLTVKGARLPAYFYAARTRALYLAHGRVGLTLANVGWTLGNLISYVRPLLGKPMPHRIDREWQDIWTSFLHPMKPHRP